MEPPRRDVYTTHQPDGTYVTTTTSHTTKYKEGNVWSCGAGLTDRNSCVGLLGILRILIIFFCLVVISLVTSVFGPGPFKGVLFGQTLLLIAAGVAMMITFIYLIAYFFTLNTSHLDFFCWYESELVFTATSAIVFFILSFVEGYYSTGSWSNNCNDIGSDGIIHNGCRLIYEWAFAAFWTFVLAILFAVNAFFIYRSRHQEPIRRDLY